MKKTYHEAIYPAQRTTAFSAEEQSAYNAAAIIQDRGEEALYYAAKRCGQALPQSEAGRVSRRRISPSENLVIVSASRDFFAATDEWFILADPWNSQV